MIESQNNQETDELSLRELIEQYSRYWYLFAIGVVTALVIAFIYLRYAPQLYQSKATIIIKDEKSQSPLEMAAFSQFGGFLSRFKSNQIDNELAIFNSKRIISNAVEQLKLNIKYEVIGNIKASELYGYKPFEVRYQSFDEAYTNKPIPTLYFEILSDTEFAIEDVTGSSKATYKFGERISLPFGNITVLPNMENPTAFESYIDKSISVSYNTVENVALSLQSQVNILNTNDKSNVVELSIQTENKEKGEDFLNELVIQYNKDAVQDRNEIARKTSEFIESRLEIIELAEKLGAPVLTTFKGKGLISDAHPNAAGVLGRSGTPVASWFMNEADLIIALGSSFANHTGIERSKPIIQVDFERMQLGKFHPVELPIWGEIGAFCAAVAPRLSQAAGKGKQIKELAERWRIWREEKKTRLQEERGQGIHSAAIFQSLSELCPEDAIIAVDVGNNTYSFGRYFETKGQRVLMSGYLGSIGFGFPAAMGAWAATQDFEDYAGRQVISISGDGGFGQYPMDFTTAVKYGMNITHILLNNSELGKISKEQRSGEWPVWETNLHNPSFAAFARLCGGHGVKVTETEGIRQALKDALAYEGPALVEVITDAELV